MIKVVQAYDRAPFAEVQSDDAGGPRHVGGGLAVTDL
jgi:hypothetical protein